METLNRAIEGAALFDDMMLKITKVRHSPQDVDPCTKIVDPACDVRQPGENRAMHRERLRRERRSA